MANEGSFLSGALVGIGSSLISSATSSWSKTAQIGTGGLSGGLISELTGGNFTQGFASGLTVSALNHALHGVSQALENNGIVGIYGAGGKNAGDNPTLEDIVKGKGGKMRGWFNNAKRIAATLKKAYKNGKTIEIYGYSRGGNAAVAVANILGEDNVFVSKLVLFDPHTFGDNNTFILKGDNVRTIYNFYQRNERTSGSLGWSGSNPYWGSPVSREYGNMTNINQYNYTGKNFTYGRPVSHLNIIRHALINVNF